MTLLAYHGDPAIKEKYLARVKMHRELDHLVQGTGWESNGETKGCAVGCALEAYDHSLYPTELGIPEELAHLEDAIFEGLSWEKAEHWPERFLNAIKTGADLSMVWPRFSLWLLSAEDSPMFKAVQHDTVKAAIDGVAAIYRKWVDTGVKPPAKEFEAARASARAAAEVEVAKASAWAAAWAAEVAAWAAEVAKASAWAAALAARAAAWTNMADKLEALLIEGFHLGGVTMFDPITDRGPSPGYYDVPSGGELFKCDWCEGTGLLAFDVLRECLCECHQGRHKVLVAQCNGKISAAMMLDMVEDIEKGQGYCRWCDRQHECFACKGEGEVEGDPQKDI